MENREAINALKDLLDTTREYPHLDGMTMFGDAIDLAISALEKQEQDRWHSVAKEGNPKKSGLYIVVDKNPINGNEPHTRYFNAYGDAPFWSGWKADEVIAWKEITSEPYTEEKYENFIQEFMSDDY